MTPSLRTHRAFTVLELMIITAIIAILLVIAIPGFFRARELSARSSCQENLAKVDQAKQQWALHNHKRGDDVPVWPDLVGNDLYIRNSPVCPVGGSYTINAVDTFPACDYVGIPLGHPFPMGAAPASGS